MRMLISGFSPAKKLGTRANQKISGYNRIRVDAKIFTSAKNICRKKISAYVWTWPNTESYEVSSLKRDNDNPKKSSLA